MNYLRCPRGGFTGTLKLEKCKMRDCQKKHIEAATASIGNYGFVLYRALIQWIIESIWRLSARVTQSWVLIWCFLTFKIKLEILHKCIITTFMQLRLQACCVSAEARRRA